MPINESHLVEACVANHYHPLGKTFYFKGQGEIDVIFLKEKTIQAIEVKWAEQVRPNDLKMLKQFQNARILAKNSQEGSIENINVNSVYKCLGKIDH